MSCPKASKEKSELHKKRKRVILLCGISFAIALLFAIAHPWYRLGFNRTSSLPGYVYFIEVKPKGYVLNYDDTVIFYAPNNPSHEDGSRFMKIVKGKPGDILTFKENNFFLNGVFLGKAKPKSSNGRALKQTDGGEIPSGNYFVWTSHEDSYDSRYAEIGFIPRERIFGVAHRLF